MTLGAPQYMRIAGDRYGDRWDDMVTTSAAQAAIDAVAQRLCMSENKTKYQNATLGTQIPWFMIAVLHYRETGANDFLLTIMSSEPFDKQATLFPYHGPYASWEDSARDAVNWVGLDTVNPWKWERLMYQLEEYNTWGYFRRGQFSPYLWACTNHYERGKFTDENTWEPNTVDAMFGCCPILKAMQVIDPSVDLPREGGGLLVMPLARTDRV